MKIELDTVGIMIDLYCRGHHGSKDVLCPECGGLLAYVKGRLEKCPLKEKKPWCSKCTVHCYKPDMREKIKSVMRYAGPRMIWRHPVLTCQHYLSGFKRRLIRNIN